MTTMVYRNCRMIRALVSSCIRKRTMTNGRAAMWRFTTSLSALAGHMRIRKVLGGSSLPLRIHFSTFRKNRRIRILTAPGVLGNLDASHSFIALRCAPRQDSSLVRRWMGTEEVRVQLRKRFVARVPMVIQFGIESVGQRGAHFFNVGP